MPEVGEHLTSRNDRVDVTSGAETRVLGGRMTGKKAIRRYKSVRTDAANC